MFIKTHKVKNWKSLQIKVSQLFVEMGYRCEIEKKVKLAGRGHKEIDVFVTDPMASYNKKYLIECKWWSKRVSQETVHAFKTVMEEVGANTGFIISKKGFQSGAYEASRYTNIKLLNFEELQHLYGNEWFNKQNNLLKINADKLQQVYNLHFDKQSNLGIINNIYFHTPDLEVKLCYLGKWVLNLILDVNSISPKSYKGPEPVQITNNPFDPSWQSIGWYEFPSVRNYFEKMIEASESCLSEFNELYANAKLSYESLPDSEQGDLHSLSMARFAEETPLRVLKRMIPQDEYQKLMKLIMPTFP